MAEEVCEMVLCEMVLVLRGLERPRRLERKNTFGVGSRMFSEKKEHLKGKVSLKKELSHGLAM